MQTLLYILSNYVISYLKISDWKLYTTKNKMCEVSNKHRNFKMCRCFCLFIHLLYFKYNITRYNVLFPNFPQVYFLIFLKHILLTLKFALQYFVPDEPLFITRHLRRQEHIVETLIEGAQYIEDDEIASSVGEVGGFFIFI